MNLLDKLVFHARAIRASFVESAEEIVQAVGDKIVRSTCSKTLDHYSEADKKRFLIDATTTNLVPFTFNKVLTPIRKYQLEKCTEEVQSEKEQDVGSKAPSATSKILTGIGRIFTVYYIPPISIKFIADSLIQYLKGNAHDK